MFDIVNGNSSLSNEWVNIFLLTLAFLRVYLEIIKFDLSALPLTKVVFKGNTDGANKFHKTGLFFCLGYIIFAAPSILLF